MPRRNETQTTRFRSCRYLFINNQWYVATRESSDVGPFDTRKIAEYWLGLYIEAITVHRMIPTEARNYAYDKLCSIPINSSANTNFGVANQFTIESIEYEKPL